MLSLGRGWPCRAWDLLERKTVKLVKSSATKGSRETVGKNGAGDEEIGLD